MREPLIESLVPLIEPEFRAAMHTLESGATIGPERTALPGLAEQGIGVRFIEKLAGPVLQVAAGLIFQRVHEEAQIVLDAEKAAHPGWDLSGIQRFFDSLKPTLDKAGG